MAYAKQCPATRREASLPSATAVPCLQVGPKRTLPQGDRFADQVPKRCNALQLCAPAPTCADHPAPLDARDSLPVTADMTGDRREGAEVYVGELFRETTPAGIYRVVLCRDGMQWVMQRRSRGAGSPAGGRWKAEAYVTRRDSLERLWRAATGTVAEEIRALPDRIQRTL